MNLTSALVETAVFNIDRIIPYSTLLTMCSHRPLGGGLITVVPTKDTSTLGVHHNVSDSID